MKLPLTPLRFLYRARDQFGDKVGVIDGERRWTYAEHAERCHRLANLLAAWNLKPRGRVAFLSYNAYPLLESYYGVLLAGGILLPLNIRLHGDDFTYILNDAEADFLFFHPDFLPVVEQIRDKLETVRRFILLEEAQAPEGVEPQPYDDLIAGQGPDFLSDVGSVDDDEVAELFYTSGTTARPKGVMLTHRNLYLHALQCAISLGVSDGEVQLHTIPLFHVNGWGTPQFLTCLGGTHVLLKKFEPGAVLELIQRHRVTTLSLVPTMATALLHYPGRESYDVSSLRLVSLGGAASTPQLIRALEEAFSCTCLGGYGLTETTPVLTLAIPKSHLTLSEEERYTLQAMTGYPLPGIELRLVDAEGKDLPRDGRSVGEIVVRGDVVMKGYWKQPEETAEAFRGGWFHTGDMAVIDPRGYVLIVDRKKEIIVSGGENISSLEVEKVLLAHPAVLECAVIPVPDPTWGEVPKALLVTKPGRQASQDEILAYCRAHLAGFKVPRSVDFFDSLPKGGTGKILKRELRERYWAGHERRVHPL